MLSSTYAEKTQLTWFDKMEPLLGADVTTYSGLTNQMAPILIALIRLIFHQVDSRPQNYWIGLDMSDYYE